MSYNLTFMETSTDILQVANGVNSASNNYLGAFILLMVAVISFVVMKKYDTKASIIATSFITSIVAMYLYFAQWISITFFIIPAVICFIGLFMVIIQQFSSG